MAHEDKSWNSQAWPFWSWPAGMLDALKMPVSAGAPQSLTQPILPWVFAHFISVNENNSSCPEMEREIVAQSTGLKPNWPGLKKTVLASTSASRQNFQFKARPGGRHTRIAADSPASSALAGAARTRRCIALA